MDLQVRRRIRVSTYKRTYRSERGSEFLHINGPIYRSEGGLVLEVWHIAFLPWSQLVASVIWCFHMLILSANGWRATASCWTHQNLSWSGLRHHDLIDRSPFVLPVGVIIVSLSVQNLGAFFDEEMSMSDHDNRLVRSCFYHLRRFKFIRRSLTTTTTKMLVNS